MTATNLCTLIEHRRSALPVHLPLSYSDNISAGVPLSSILRYHIILRICFKLVRNKEETPLRTTHIHAQAHAHTLITFSLALGLVNLHTNVTQVAYNITVSIWYVNVKVCRLSTS
jgi:hypothetical protein